MVTMIRSDLDFILAQIKIAEADAEGINLVPNSELPWGLRRVDGSNNNLTPGQENYGAADQVFPRTEPAVRPNDQDGDSITFGRGPGATVLTDTNYGDFRPNDSTDPRAIQPGDVVDADPRIISNLIVDQTANNPAAIFKALQDAGLSNEDAFAELQLINAAVQNIKTLRASSGADTTPLLTALQQAQATATQEANEATLADSEADTAESQAAAAQVAASGAEEAAPADDNVYDVGRRARAPLVGRINSDRRRTDACGCRGSGDRSGRPPGDGRHPFAAGRGPAGHG